MSIMNITWTEPVKNILMSRPECKDWCLEQLPTYIHNQYEFVWFFILAFLFSNLKTVIYSLPIEDAKLKHSIASGCSVASYVLNMMGIFSFLVMI